MTDCLLCEDSFTFVPTIADLFAWRPLRVRPICPDCRAGFSPLGPDTCPGCSRTMPEAGQVCPDCQLWEEDAGLARGLVVAGAKVGARAEMDTKVAPADQLSFQNRACYHYDDNFRRWILLIKGRGDLRLADLFREDLVRFDRQHPGYTWVPVPSSDENYRKRGFHQTEAILHFSEIPFRPLLGLADAGSKQALRQRTDRLQNQRTFYIIDETDLPDKVILFDDIYTTGATIRQAAHMLKRAGVEEVIGMTLGR